MHDDMGNTLVVQIPCLNEKATLPCTIKGVPRTIPGIERVFVLVIDDGSTDGTAQVARDAGADFVLRHRSNKGLAAAFKSGIDASLAIGADIIVNTDGDHQYDGSSIPDLIGPILAEQADMVVGDRQTDFVADFPYYKRVLQRFGSLIVRRVSGVRVPDAVSGFRAFTREHAARMNVLSTFSYTIETLIHAGQLRASVKSVPVKVNRVHRESRLFRSVPEFVIRSGVVTLRSYAMYYPLRTFVAAGAILSGLGSLAFFRFLYFYYWTNTATGHTQSLVFGGTLFGAGCLLFAMGIFSDLAATNRRLVEDLLYRNRIHEPNNVGRFDGSGHGKCRSEFENSGEDVVSLNHP